MKKLTTLVLAAGLVVSSFAGSASAGEFKPFAQFAEEFTYGNGDRNGVINNPDPTIGYDQQSYEEFNAATRIRFGFDYIQSEDLSATMMFQYEHASWGDNARYDNESHRNHNLTKDPQANLQMRLAYIDWTIPTTDVKVRMGRQAVVAPSYAFGSAILDGRADAVSITGNVNDNISLGFTWARLASADTIIGSNTYQAADDADFGMIQAEFAYDGWKLAPWFMFIQNQAMNGFYNNLGNALPYPQPVDGKLDQKYGSQAYVLGASFELSMFDPFVFAIDALYNKIDFKDGKYWTLDRVTQHGIEDSYDGFYVGLSGKYKLNNGTVALKGWYATGDDANEKNEARDSFIRTNGNAFVLLDGGFSATTMLFGDNIIGKDAFNTLSGDSPFGTWGIVAEYAGFSFMDKLTHTARVAYVTGTNEALYDANGKRMHYGSGLDNDYNVAIDFAHLTKDDSIIEVNFNSTYEIYQNLSATLELGYMFISMDNLADGVDEHDDIFRSALTFVYNF